MKITVENYFDKISEFMDFVNSDAALLATHDFFVKATNGGKSLEAYHASTGLQETIGIYLARINAYLQKKSKTPKNGSRRPSAAALHTGSENPGPAPEKKSTPGKLKNSKTNNKTTFDNTVLVERLPDELKFIRRFVHLHGKTKYKDELLRFINSLQKAIVEKRIRKTSAYADHIRTIQKKLIDTYNSMKAKIAIELKPETLEELSKLVGTEKVLVSVGFIKRYIGLNGKTGIKEKAKQMLTQINRAIDKGKILGSDPYNPEIFEIKKNLKEFVTDPKVKTLDIQAATLNGLEGILGCACQDKRPAPTPTIMNSIDFADLEFDTIGLRGKWYSLIGDPSTNFTAMVFGKPKMGKSYLCIDFAGYLARNHGKVLYVAKEEGLDYTLQQKLNDKDVAHPNLFVASVLPENLAAFDFIFLDSVNKLGLKPIELNKLKSQNPTKSFIFIFQSTKSGQFRGENSFQHDVDVVIEIPEKGRAVQMGRFNQGGEMEIF